MSNQTVNDLKSAMWVLTSVKTEQALLEFDTVSYKPPLNLELFLAFYPVQ
jgi:hypothetical protein